ncbi:MAG TPA: prepilin-type N-terminal cleavage/methylation domain-containing protein [bacterium]|nr:prepilin-type N-terminal cleavage/methylation domain-containing protein [bacterium]
MMGCKVMLRDFSGKGFTLIEMVVVIAIIALLAGVITPLVFNVLDDANESTTREEMAHIREAAVNYYRDVNQWPPTRVSDGSNVYSGLKMLAATKTSYGYLLPCDSSGQSYLYAVPVPSYDASTGMGWNGPYATTESETDGGLYADSWSNEYAYMSYSGYYVVYIDPDSDSPMQGEAGGGYISVPIQPARVFIASKGRDQRHTDVVPSSTPKMKSDSELYPENGDDIVLLIAGTDYGKSWWYPIAATEAYK